MTNFILEYDAFIRSIKVNSTTSHALLLGAGASISSGVQTATDCIWEWKKDIFVTKNPQQAHRFTNYRDEQVREHIQRWLDNEGSYPKLGTDEEYSYYALKAYPIDGDRQSYFERIIEGKKPAMGYHLMCLLGQTEIIRSIWTTNFDNLAYKAAIQNNMEASKINLANVGEIYQPFKRNNLICVALHGDYKFGPMKNTTEELDSQNETFIDTLKRYFNDKNLIVSGYSGRDKSLMEALTQVYNQAGSGRLYWCGRGIEINSAIEKLLFTARANGREAFYIPTEGFDETMLSLAKVCFESKSEYQEKLAEILSSSTQKQDTCTPFTMEVPHFNTVLKGNLFPISYPKSIFQFDCRFETEEKPWQIIKELTKDEPVTAGIFKGKVYAFGIPDKIHDLFKERINGNMERSPLSDNDLHNSVISRLLIQTITVSLSTIYPSLFNNRKDFVWSKRVEFIDEFKGKKYSIHRGMRLKFVADSTHRYLCCKPQLHVENISDNEAIPKEFKQNISNSYFKKLYNKEYEIYIDNFCKLLFPNGKRLEFDFPLKSEVGFGFKISPSPGFAKIMQSGSRFGITLAPHFNKNRLIHHGIQYPEPELIFTGLSGNEVKDFHPMRGLINNRPYDFHISSSVLSEEIRLGVICPKPYAEKFYRFLNLQNQTVQTLYNGKKHNADYLMDFPSFYSAFGVALKIPHWNEPQWMDSQNPINTNVKQGALELANILSQQIERASNEGVSVVIIFIPKIWESYRSFSDETEDFDLHDYLKAFSAERNIATQLIEEDTLSDRLGGQIAWWLSLSFYVKARRMPWILANSDKKSAYVGIGYSVNKHRNKGKIVLGCSHIYNPQGQGLKYKLSKVDEPIWDSERRNPYLSYQDAFKFGFSVANLSRDTFIDMVDRIAVHKRTHFTEDEINGIVSGLAKGGIHNVDLIEVNFEENIRFTANRLYDNMPQTDSFPLSRGTCILMSSRKALLWTHGVVPSVQNSRNRYYLGGNGIPTPLVIKKHYGNSNIGTIANEILGLTKVNWNSMDLYSVLPATLTSSNKIAQIGSLLSRFEKPYDYRYFI